MLPQDRIKRVRPLQKLDDVRRQSAAERRARAHALRCAECLRVPICACPSLTRHRWTVKAASECVESRATVQDYEGLDRSCVLGVHPVTGSARSEIRDSDIIALIGPNGGGKTTVLGAAGIIYRSVKPRLFFAKSGKYDQSMQNWSVEYD